MMEPRAYPVSAVERAMKVQDVILRAMDGRLKWYQAAERLGTSDTCGACIRLIPQINPTRTQQSTPRVFNKSIRIAEDTPTNLHQHRKAWRMFSWKGWPVCDWNRWQI